MGQWVKLSQTGQKFGDGFFQFIFVSKNWLCSDSDLKFVLKDRIASKLELVWIRWQAIIWTNDGLFYWCIYASLCLTELIIQI